MDRFTEHDADSPTADPAWWWRQLCWVTDRIIVTGDLADDDAAAEDQVHEWAAAGVTLIVDVRSECSDRSRVAEFHPEIEYLHAPTHDHGGVQPDEWFDDTVDHILETLESNPSAVVLIHCHMGVNRAPSMTMAVLMVLGSTALEALDAIRSARPIAAVLYADQVADWYHRRHYNTDEHRESAIDAVRRWHQANPVDTQWVISRINRRDLDDRLRERWWIPIDDGNRSTHDDESAA
jgi:protein-tyrosine phosphatase